MRVVKKIRDLDLSEIKEKFLNEALPVLLRAEFLTAETTKYPKNSRAFAQTEPQRQIPYTRWVCYLFLVRLSSRWLLKIGHAPDPIARCRSLMYAMNRAYHRLKADPEMCARYDNEQDWGGRGRVRVPLLPLRNRVRAGWLLCTFAHGSSVERALHRHFRAHRFRVAAHFSGSSEFFAARPVLAELNLKGFQL